MTTRRDLAQIELQELRQRLETLKSHRDAMPPGVRSVSVDGISTTFDRKALMNEIAAVERKIAVLSGKRQRVATIRLDGS